MINSIAEWFQSGGTFMWIILSVLALALGIMLDRFIFYFIVVRENGNVLLADVAKRLNKNDIKGAKEIVSSRKTPLNILFKRAVEGVEDELSFDEIKELIEIESVKQLPRLSERLNYLSLFANVSTLLGLLGTISGLQVSFSSLANVEASQKAAMLASGISQAMNTTSFGLIVAVPCMVAFTFLNNRREKLIKDLDESIVKLLSYLKKKVASQQ